MIANLERRTAGYGAALVPVVFLIIILAAGGCASTQPTAVERGDADSLRTIQRRLQAQLYQVRDSLRFYEDIRTGRYFRDRRLLTDRINDLQYDVTVAMEGGVTASVLQVDALFSPGSAELVATGRNRIAQLAQRLTDEYGDGYVFRVEGHSDNVPIGPGLADRYPSNWELSAARAAAVARVLIAEGIAPDRVAVVSFGATRPVARNDIAAGRAKNRRIRIGALPPKTFEELPAPPQ